MKKALAFCIVVVLCSLLLSTPLVYGQCQSSTDRTNKFLHVGCSIPNEYIVAFKDCVAREDVESVAAELARKYDGTIKFIYKYAIKGFSVRMQESSAIALSQDPRVDFVEENGVVEAAESSANPIDDKGFFVRQHYLDFLDREPEPEGLAAWTCVLRRCSFLNNDPTCDRIEVSSSFFRSEEFQLKGYFVYRFYKVSLGRLPHYAEIITDMKSVTGQNGDEVTAKKAAFTNAWMQRAEFKAIFDSLTDPAAYVDRLLQIEGITLTGAVTRESLVQDLQTGRKTRAEILRAIVEHPDVDQKEFNGAFVAMEYFGYLRRDPEPEGYDAWLRVINRGDSYRVMVNGFINSNEYRRRFNSPQ